MYGMELYAAVRRAVVDEGLSHHEASRRFGIDRRTVKKMLSYSAPPGYRRTKPVGRPKLDGFTGIVDAILEAACQWRSKKGPPWRCKKGPLGGCGLVPVVHGRAPRATRRALNRPTRRRAREGPVGPRGQAWVGWSVQFAVGV